MEHPSNNNRSDSIDYWNRLVGVPLGSSWCCSYVSRMLQLSGSSLKRSGSCYRFSMLNNLDKFDITKLESGSIVVWNRANHTGHIGIVVRRAKYKGYYLLIEGNTSADDSSPDGRNSKGRQGVFLKVRDLTKPLMAGCPPKYIYINKDKK